MNDQLDLINIKDCTVTQTGANFSKGLSFQDWLKVGRSLCYVHGASNFWLGEWVNFGAGEYGEKYKEALELTGLEYDSLCSMASVSELVPKLTRVSSLSWSHHREVCQMASKDQKHWLAKAAEGAGGKPWTVSELRRAIRLSIAQFSNTEPDPGIFRFAKSADDLCRYLRIEDVSTWTEERKAACRKVLQPAKDELDKLWNVA